MLRPDAVSVNLQLFWEPTARLLRVWHLWHSPVPMPTSTIAGRLKAIEGDVIILGGTVRITLLPGVSVAACPIGCSVTVVARQEADGHLVGSSIKRNDDWPSE